MRPTSRFRTTAVSARAPLARRRYMGASERNCRLTSATSAPESASVTRSRRRMPGPALRSTSRLDSFIPAKAPPAAP